jgi:hypothetical protein
MASSSSSSETHGASKLTAPDQRCSATLACCQRVTRRRFHGIPIGGLSRGVEQVRVARRVGRQ